jgi:tRNA(Leu) C34 or U34 (ribose-2'-O)-methylase TrmL
MRLETRAQRYAKKARDSKIVKLPFAFAATNFTNDGNVAFLSRALACFGGHTMHIIGRMPSEHELSRLSGGHSRLVKWVSYKNPTHFLSDNQDKELVCAELDDRSVPLNEVKWNYVHETIVILGNEMDGIPVEIMAKSKLVELPMKSKGWCLNTSMTGNIIGYDYMNKYLNGSMT